MIIIKKFVNALTISRIVGAAALLLIHFLNLNNDLPMFFFAIYIACVATDIADGPIARKTKTATNTGALLDSIADFVLIITALVIFIPRLDFTAWMLSLVALVLGIRFIALGIGYAKYRTITLLHTYANKGSALILALFPVLFEVFGLAVGFAIMAGGAIISALEELLITIRSKQLDRNITWLFGTPKAV